MADSTCLSEEEEEEEEEDVGDANALGVGPILLLLMMMCAMLVVGTQRRAERTIVHTTTIEMDPPLECRTVISS
jgi:hypothetical protein